MIVEDALCFHFQLREENAKLTIKILTGTSQVTCALIHISFPFWKQYWLIKTYFSSLPWSITHMISSNHMLHEPLRKNFFNPVKVQTFSISACSKKQAQKGTMPPNVHRQTKLIKQQRGMTNPSQFYTHHTALPPIFKNLWHIIMFQDNHNAFIAEKQSASLHHTIPFPSPPSLTVIMLSIHHTDLLCLS